MAEVELANECPRPNNRLTDLEYSRRAHGHFQLFRTRTRYVQCMGMGLDWDSHGNPMGMGTQLCRNGNGDGKSTVTVGMGMATFSCVPKFPSVDSMRMESNKM